MGEDKGTEGSESLGKGCDDDDAEGGGAEGGEESGGWYDTYIRVIRSI
jgi:hypothetical protein